MTATHPTQESVVLHVEDNPAHARLVERAFESCGIRVRIDHVADGQAALDYLARDELPRLILLDLRIPKLSGHEVLDALEQEPRLRTIPVVVLSSSEAEADVQGAYQRHANSYLVKPLELERLQELVRTIAEYWLELNEPRLVS